ncbi:MAG: protein-glutamate O-methyltransferase CheR [Nitrospirae bacterium]|nr:protein-glutamate O-methyltransferase CheR [Nitrospirota bacterium]MBI5694169.1 protein-glutamate O-methyltransferase CheR [Nitrospirota bacterium]
MLFQEDLMDLPEDVFRLLRDYIRDYCGMYFDDNSKYLLQRRLTRRVRLHQFKSFKDYYHFLTYDRRKEEELVEVIDSLTTNETYFFREEAQLKAFTDEIVPEIAKRKEDRTLRIWSAGCSTGEEPYTIAMLLMEKGYCPGWDIEIIGSDINQKVLGSARRAIYKKSAFRTTDDRRLARFFKEDSPGNYKIADEVRKMVSFSYLNLFDPYKLSFLKDFDLIFCRNVIIYFDMDSKKKLVETFYNKLVPGGYLLLGHAESLMNISAAFKLVHLTNDMVYQKPAKVGVGAPICRDGR